MKSTIKPSEAEALAQSENRYLALAQMCGFAVIVESRQKVVFANRRAAELFSMANSDELLGKNIRDLIPSFEAGACGAGAAVGSPDFTSHHIKRADGEVLEVEIAVDACRFQRQDAIQMVLRRTSSLPEVRTVLPYSDRFRDRVAAAMATADRNDTLLAVMILAIDYLGTAPPIPRREAVELVLENIASRVMQGVRRSDAIAKVGPNEYAILLEGLDEPVLAAMVAQRKLEAVAGPLAPDGTRTGVTASIGIALFSRDMRDANELIDNARCALAVVRNAGGNGYLVHSPAMDDPARRDSVLRSQVPARLARLTPRERQVLDMLVLGRANKMIAYLLGTSVRTIDSHRARVMEKMQADSVAALVTMVLANGQGPAEDPGDCLGLG